MSPALRPNDGAEVNEVIKNAANMTSLEALSDLHAIRVGDSPQNQRQSKCIVYL